MKKKTLIYFDVSLNCLFRNWFFFLLLLPRVFLSLSLSLSIKSERDSLGMIILMEALKGGMVSSKSRERLRSSLLTRLNVFFSLSSLFNLKK